MRRSASNGNERRDLISAAADALASKGNLLRRNGWHPMAGYQSGTWNESTAYQRTIARFAAVLR
jgi:membrane-bound lytic murein transglycosylase B